MDHHAKRSCAPQEVSRGQHVVELSYRVRWNERDFSASCPERNLCARGPTMAAAVNALRVAATMAGVTRQTR
jgi:hypothetical protein